MNHKNYLYRNKSESSIASENIQINSVPWFLISAAERDSELRKYVQISCRMRSKRQKLKSQMVSEKNRINIEPSNNPLMVKSISSKGEFINRQYFSKDNKNEESKYNSKNESDQELVSNSIDMESRKCIDVINIRPSKRSDSSPISGFNEMNIRSKL